MAYDTVSGPYLAAVAVFALAVAGCGGGSGGGGGGGGSGGAPVAADAILFTDRNTALAGQLEASDADGDALTYAIVTGPTLGTVSLTAATGAFTYTPNTDAIGPDEFTFRANDGDNDSNLARITIGINPNFTINLSGGLGGASGGRGGSAGTISARLESRGDLAILRAGPADASFTAHTPTPNLGANPLVLAADDTVLAVVDEPAADRLYINSGQPPGSFSNLYLSNGNGTAFEAEEIVTGLDIPTGITLTVELNDGDNARIRLVNDLRNRGSFAPVDVDSTRRGNLDLRVSSYLGDGLLATAGSADGQAGGAVSVRADFSLYAGGRIDTRGADGTTAGGPGGRIELTSSFALEYSGVLLAAGGSGSSGSGGAGGEVQLTSRVGSMYLAGSVDTGGGDGTAGASAGPIGLTVESVGDVLTSMDLRAAGGVGSQNEGGSGGQVDMNVRGGHLVTTGTILANGGDTLSTTTSGGPGGNLNLNLSTGDSATRQSSRAPRGDLLVSGDIDLSGGAAVATGQGSGGRGGQISINSEAFDVAGSQSLALLGYDRIAAAGGDGNSGGTGGNVALDNIGVSQQGEEFGSGSVINEAELVLSGGDVAAQSSSAGIGGRGGTVILQTDFRSATNPDGETVINRGAIDARDGVSLDAPRSVITSERVRLWGFNGVTNEAAINIDGSSDRLDDGSNAGFGRSTSRVELLSEVGPVDNQGAISARGGAGQFNGGSGGEVFLIGDTVSSSAPVTVSGGDANPAIAGSRGGPGGRVAYLTEDGVGGLQQSAGAAVGGGSGETAGQSGTFVEGGLCVQTAFDCTDIF